MATSAISMATQCTSKRATRSAEHRHLCVRTQQDGTFQAIEPPKILAKILKWTVHMLEIFWWREDYYSPADVELEGKTPLWSVRVEYSNDEIQNMGSADDVPAHVCELLSALAKLFG